MNHLALWVLLTCLASLAFLGTILVALTTIVPLLEQIGGSGESYLARLRLGLRAIERETSHMPATVPDINGGLEQVASGLIAVDDTLGGLHGALIAQEARP